MASCGRGRSRRGYKRGDFSVELPEEGLEVLADDAVEHPMLGGATHVGSRGIGAKIGVKLHG